MLGCFGRHGRIDKSDVRVSIGVGIPAGIALAQLPPDIVVVAADCPLQYFLWGDDVVLVASVSDLRLIKIGTPNAHFPVKKTVTQAFDFGQARGLQPAPKKPR